MSGVFKHFDRAMMRAWLDQKIADTQAAWIVAEARRTALIENPELW